MLCKHEVVGSIPSGSTILLGLGVVETAAARESGCRARYLEHEFAAVTQQQGPSGSAERSVGEDISDIVKRECGRWGREICQPRRSCSASIRWWVRKRICHWSFCDRVVIDSLAAADQRTSITRAIKCLKSIRWMPWR